MSRWASFVPRSFRSRRVRAGSKNPRGTQTLGPPLSIESLERRVFLCGDMIIGSDLLQATSSPVLGEKKILYVRAAFSDHTDAPQTLASAQDSMTQTDAFVRENSYGQAFFTTTITDVMILPQTEAYYAQAGYNVLRTDALNTAAAANASWNYLNYDLDAVRWNGGPSIGAAGLASVGSRGNWLQSDAPDVAAHEFGHNLGLLHANSWDPTDRETIIGTGANHEYGNDFDLMGHGGLNGDFNVYEKNHLQWLPDGDVTTVTAGGTYTIYPFDVSTLDSVNRQYAIKVRKDNERDYWLGVRGSADFAQNPSVVNGIEVNWDPWSATGGTELLDMAPQTTSVYDSFLPVGKTFSDTIDGVHITPVAKNADGSFEVHVELANPADRAPAATLSATSSAVLTGTSVTFTASASDPDGDALSYYWDFGDGTVSTNSPSVSKAWTRSGDFRVRVTASDMKGKTASASVMVRVGEVRSARVSGQVLDTFGLPIQDAKVSGLGSPTYTDANGGYTLSEVGPYTSREDPGPGPLSVSKPGWTFAPANGGTGSVQWGPETVGADFRGTETDYTVSGKVQTSSPNSVPIANVLVTDGVHSVTTDAAGNYSFNAGNGSYTLTFTKPGYTINPVVAKVAYGNAFNATTLSQFQIRGTLQGMSGYSNATVTVTDGVRTVTAVRQPNGDYSYTINSQQGVWNLSVSATEISTGRVIGMTPLNFTNPATVPAPTGTTYNFTATPAAFTVRGRVTDMGDALYGATVSAGGVTTTTDPNGGYALAGLVNGTYTVTASKAGYSFTPATRTVTVSGNNLVGQDFATTTANQAPTITSPAAADPPAGTPTGARLTVGATDDRGAPSLIYTWSVVSTPAGGTVSFTRNNSYSASTTIATFNKAGTYVLQVLAKDRNGGQTPSQVTVNVAPVLSAVAVSPGASVVAAMASEPLSATALDQFGTPMATQPALTWSVTGTGAITAGGLYTAGRGTREDSVNAYAGSVGGSATVGVQESRFVFYNNSSYDGNSPAADDLDDNAVAVDKYALLPGQTATFGNYTGYSRGINGIMVDLPSTAGTPTLADFVFKVGNDSNPAGWANAPTPTAILVRPFYGGNFSTRVTITWADNAIQKQWLQVKVLANANTGLSSPDLFYFGNLIGETGNTTADAKVNALDIAGTHAHPDTLARLNSRFDVDRDGDVDTVDEQILQQNLNSVLTLFTA